MLDEQLARSDGALCYAALLDQGGRVLSSLKRYRLYLAFGGETLPALGIGAVFTPAVTRRRGLAAELIGRALEQARREGMVAGLLFSDIDPSYYARLGFTLLPHDTWSASTSALPPSSLVLRTEATDDIAALLPFYRRSLPPRSLRAARSIDSWRYWAWRNALPVSQRLLAEAGPVGYLTVQRDGELLWLADAAAADIERPRVLATLRRLAEQVGATRVAGWLPPELAGPPFARTARTRCLPMLKRLDERLDRWQPAAAHFFSFDCY